MDTFKNASISVVGTLMPVVSRRMRDVSSLS